jgi:hypothetical protein
MRMPAPLVLATLIATPLVGMLPARAAATPGALVKLVSDNNPATTTDAAVYVLGADGKRYVFPNEATYRSWYADFSGVQELSAGDLAALSIGGNVTMRPGTRLVKITTDPRVYAVEPGGVLRAIPSEAVATGLFGSDWARRVDDVPDAFFINYVLGPALPDDTPRAFADGALLRDNATSEVWFLDGGRRRLVAADALSALRRASGTISSVAPAVLDVYPRGLELTPDEAAVYADPSFDGVRLTASPTFASLQAGQAADLLTVTLSSSRAVRLGSVGVRVSAPGDVVTGSPDSDAGGLVRHIGERENIGDFTLRTSTGTVVASASLSLDPAKDGTQLLSFVPAQPVPLAAGERLTLTLRAVVDADVAAGQRFVAALDADTTQVVDARTGATLRPRVLSGLKGEELVVNRPGLAVRALPASRAAYVRGTPNAELARFALSVSGDARTVRELSFQGYVDKQEGVNAFSLGQDSSGSVKTGARDLVDALSLVDVATGRVLAPAAGITDGGRVTFSALTIKLASGAPEVVLALVGTIDGDVNLESNPDRVAFDLQDGRVDIAAFDDAGFRRTVETVTAPNGGNTPGQYVSIRKFGAASFAWQGVTAEAARGSEVRIGTLTATARYDTYALRSFVLRDGAQLAGFSGFRVEYGDDAGVTRSASGFRNGDTVIFSGIGAHLPIDVPHILDVYATVDANAVVGSRVPVSFAPEVGLSLESHTPQFEAVQPSTQNGGVTVTRNDASDVTLR